MCAPSGVFEAYLYGLVYKYMAAGEGKVRIDDRHMWKELHAKHIDLAQIKTMEAVYLPKELAIAQHGAHKYYELRSPGVKRKRDKANDSKGK